MADSDLVPTRRRPAWPDLPEPLRGAIEARLGDRVVAWTSSDGGYSQGLASVLTTAAGDRVFVKAVGSEHAFTQGMYREEARRVVMLPHGVPTPAFRWAERMEAAPDDPWEVLAFDAARGRNPRIPWRDDELAAVVALGARIAEHEVAVGVLPEYADEAPMGLWKELAAGDGVGLETYDPWVASHLDLPIALDAVVPDAVRGSGLVHGDLRGDNVLLDGSAPGGAVAVDWPDAARGATFVNVVGMLPSVRLEGGPEPEDVLAAHPLPAGTDPDAVTAKLAALTGYFVEASLRPPPPGIPHLRAFQRAQAEVCIPWLRHRLRS